MTAHGEPTRNKGGRPRHMARQGRFTVALSPRLERLCSEVGRGNIAFGIREILERYLESKPEKEAPGGIT